MNISVVNQSEYTDAYVQEVIRAVNRQIAEDFAIYWHRTARLRLEGPIGRRPDGRRAEELRGDAILYLWDEIDQKEALGFHELNYRGIPFGIVFTQLSEQLGEDWSVTFSHEALELVMDPEANMLVQGPHPEDPERTVYHWYEVCDAVQAQTYEIDGIAVSNFVLPLYFTEGDEEGSRNDFLGDEKSPLPSFGVAPGGYIGFFDPILGDHGQYTAPESDARARLRARSAAGFTRRTVRHMEERSAENVVRRITGTAPEDDLPGPWFEGFSIDVRAGRRDPFDVLERALRAALGARWQDRFEASEVTDPIVDASTVSYELTPRRERAPAPSVAEAWEATYVLREQAGVADAEPEFVFFVPDSEAIMDLPVRARGLALFGSSHLAGSNDPSWSVRQIRAEEAWQLSLGQGVSVGHPDTGFFEHPEIWPAGGGGPIDTTRDHDFVAEDEDAHGVAEEDDINFGSPNHGTATASVIVSASGPSAPPVPPCPGDDTTDPVFVSGVAPGATLIPLRVSNGVVHYSWRRLRRAIEHAIREGFDVLSMSLGGPFPSRRTRALIQEATRRGMVLVAAAGNDIPFRPVVWPARYAEVVACAACNAERKPWRGSSRGSAIDITAPGESVWRAFVDLDDRADERFRIGRSSGTSYATAHVAGACALWISHHGRDALRARYGERLADAFRYVLAHTAQPSHELPSDDFGPGILDARALLERPLPSKAQVATWTDASEGLRARRAAVRPETGGALAGFRALFPALSDTELQRGLAATLGVPIGRLPRTLQEVGDEALFHLATGPRMRTRFHARSREATLSAGRRRALRGLETGLFDELARSLRSHGSPRLRARVRGGE